MDEVFIYDHARSPRGRGKSSGSLHEITSVALITQVLARLRERNNLAADAIDDVALGVVSPGAEAGATTVRIAPIAAGFSDTVGGLHLNRACASGMEAVTVSAAKIRAGWADSAIGGGYESMSRVPPGTGGGGAWGVDPALTAEHPFMMQGVAADLLASLRGVGRPDLDAYSLASQERAAKAQAGGFFDNALVPITDVIGTVVLDRDEHLRPDTTLEKLAALPAAFGFEGGALGFDEIAIQKYPQLTEIQHVHTAGSSSGVVDGAAGVLIGNREFGERSGLRPRAVIKSSVTYATDPVLFLDAPPETCRRALRRAGMGVADIDLWELNEAFAVVPVVFMDEMGVEHERLNVNGGAIALGHPLGASGAMILGTLLDELERRDQSTGVAALCAAGGMGIATVIERV
ncbi:acetyl-CoA C-acetyltransferase [Nocardia miyunensis]|uniref:acetyl-CoA C-acetyltransferase n=1 Tax=Nocardia miyunensis TaxID=282684 RepID=UPI00082DACC8|nr:acetyl-CoA C-acetyltransferase [Nocardia miyunensis]